MTTGTLPNQTSADPTELEFALETQSGFLVVIRGTGNDGRVTLAVRRRVGTPPASAIAINPDEVKRLVNVLGELCPTALKDKEKHNVVRQQDTYLDDLMGTHNEPEGNLDLFIERDFPELANRRKRGNTKPSLADPFKALNDSLNKSLGKPLENSLGNAYDAVTNTAGKLKVRPRQLAIAGASLATVIVLALSAVAAFNWVSGLSHPKAQPVAAAPVPTAGIEEFSKNFVLDMLTFKPETYRQAQVRAMAAMTPELSQKYWQETGFPLTRKQLKAIPLDQQVLVTTVTALPIGVDQFQVDVVGTVTAQAGAKVMPLHIRLNLNKDGNKLVVTEQKDLSSAPASGPTN